MRVETINKDIQALEKCLKLIEKTECYTLFNKSHLIFEICEQINILKEKAEKQSAFINSDIPTWGKLNERQREIDNK